MIDSERTGITINGKPYGNPNFPLLRNVSEGIKQMTMDGDEMLITGLEIMRNGWGAANVTVAGLDIPFAHSCGPCGYSDHYYIRRTGL